MKKGIIITIVVLVVAGIITYFILKKKKETTVTSPATTKTVADSVMGAINTLVAYTPTDKVDQLPGMDIKEV